MSTIPETVDLDALTPVVVDVEVEPWSDSCGNTGIAVDPVWGIPDGPPLDRPNTGGWVVTSRAMARRLVAAINAGAVHRDAKVVRDVFGGTYVQASSAVMAKYMNADLKRLGF